VLVPRQLIKTVKAHPHRQSRDPIRTLHNQDRCSARAPWAVEWDTPAITTGGPSTRRAAEARLRSSSPSYGSPSRGQRPYRRLARSLRRATRPGRLTKRGNDHKTGSLTLDRELNRDFGVTREYSSHCWWGGVGRRNQNEPLDYECSTTLAFQAAHPRRARFVIFFAPTQLPGGPPRPVILSSASLHGHGSIADLREGWGPEFSTSTSRPKSAPLSVPNMLVTPPRRGVATSPLRESPRPRFGERPPSTSSDLTATTSASWSAYPDRGGRPSHVPGCRCLPLSSGAFLAGRGFRLVRARSPAYVATLAQPDVDRHLTEQ